MIHKSRKLHIHFSDQKKKRNIQFAFSFFSFFLLSEMVRRVKFNRKKQKNPVMLEIGNEAEIDDYRLTSRSAKRKKNYVARFSKLAESHRRRNSFRRRVHPTQTETETSPPPKLKAGTHAGRCLRPYTIKPRKFTRGVLGLFTSAAAGFYSLTDDDGELVLRRPTIEERVPAVGAG